MKKRFLNWLTRIFIRYIPSSRKITSLEAKRISIYITENYDYSQHVTMLNEIKYHLAEFSKNEIVKKLENIDINKLDIDKISENLEKLTK